jgi:hypothetical protein
MLRKTKKNQMFLGFFPLEKKKMLIPVSAMGADFVGFRENRGRIGFRQIIWHRDWW